MIESRLKDKRVAILGFGIEGIALANFLVDQAGFITIFDQKNENELIESYDRYTLDQMKRVTGNPKIVKQLGQNLSQADLSDYDVIFRSPSVYFASKPILKARNEGKEITSQIKLFFELCPCKIIGVTGTKGKGTTASLIYEILASHISHLASHIPRLSSPNNGDLSAGKLLNKDSNVYLAGNIGYPVISLIPKLKKDDLVVLELSNFQLADIEQSPHIAVITNLGTDHLDYHKDRDEYLDAKFNILRYQSAQDYCVLNSDSTFGDLSRVKSKRLYFSSKNDQNAKAIVRVNEDQLNEVVIEKDGSFQKVCSENEILLVGKHNLENIAAASIVADNLGVSSDTTSESVRRFQGLPYRLQFTCEIDGIKFINDSFATNPGPTIAAVDAFREDKVLILGGSSKNSDFTELAAKISVSNVKAIILIGDEATKINDALLAAHYKGKVISGGDILKTAVDQAYRSAQSGDIVIFSPACASFDMFKNYKDRGQKFSVEVKELASR